MTSADVDSNLPVTLPDWLSHQAERRGPQIALRQKLRGIWASWSWRALDDDVSRVAQALGARGLVHGDRILIHGERNELCPEVIVLGLAAQRRGAAVAFVPAAVHEPSESAVSWAPALWPRFRVVRDAAALAELPPEPAPGFELRILLSARGFVPGAPPGVVCYEALLGEPRAPSTSAGTATPESGTRPRGASAEDPACVGLANAAGQRSSYSSVYARTHRELIAAAAAIARRLGDDADHDALALGGSGADWQFHNVIGPWLLRGFRLNLVENASTADYDRRELGPSLLLGAAAAYRELAERVRANLPAPGSWLRRALDRVLDAKPGSPYAWLRPWLVLGPLRDVLGVSRVRHALVLGAPPESALSSELRRLGIALDIVPNEGAWATAAALDATARDSASSATTSSDATTLHPSVRAVA